MGRVRIRWGVAVVGAVLALSATATAQSPAYTSSVTASPDPANAGQTVTLTATVTSSNGSNPGPIMFSSAPYAFNGNCSQQPVTQVAAGQYQATCAAVFLAPGTVTITAAVAGAPSETDAMPLTLVVQKGPTSVTIAPLSVAPVVGSVVVFVATIGPQGTSTDFPSGSTTFLDDGAPISGCQGVVTGPMSPGGPVQATCRTTFAAPGAHSITASFSGNQLFAGSTSTPLGVTVSPVGSGRLPMCANQDTPVPQLSLAQARASVLCLINEVLARYGESPVTGSAELDSWTQAHSGCCSLPPGFRPAGGYAAELPIEGVATPYGVIAAVMRERNTCFSLLHGVTIAGLAVVNRAVLVGTPGTVALLAQPPTWTLLVAAATPEEVSVSAPNGCPRPLPVDGAGQGAPPPPLPIIVNRASVRRDHRVEVVLICNARKGGKLTLKLTLPRAGTDETTPARGVKLHLGLTDVAVPVNAGALAREMQLHVPLVEVTVHLTKPFLATYVFELRL